MPIPKPPKFPGEKIVYNNIKPRSATFGTMPTFEEFKARFDHFLEGSWEMRLGGLDDITAASAMEGEAYPSQTTDPRELYDFIQKLLVLWQEDPLKVPYKLHGAESGRYDANEVQENAANLASTIMSSLEIEWI
jgi:hypothetical protein